MTLPTANGSNISNLSIPAQRKRVPKTRRQQHSISVESVSSLPVNNRFLSRSGSVQNFQEAKDEQLLLALEANVNEKEREFKLTKESLDEHRQTLGQLQSRHARIISEIEESGKEAKRITRSGEKRRADLHRRIEEA